MDKEKIRLLVVDDSFFMRKLLRELLEGHDDIEVIGEARDGVEAIGEATRLQPDVITMDYNMPRMNGVDAVTAILADKNNRPAIIMLSATTREGADETFACLRAGAIDYILKPSGELSLDIEKKEDEILSKIRIASRARVHQFRNLKPRGDKKKHISDKEALKFIAIGSSTGGPPVVEDILSALPGDFGAAILINQHMPPNFTKSFAERLDQLSDLVVREAVDGDEIKNGIALVAPGGYHMIVKVKEHQGKKRYFVSITDSEPVNNFRPSVDVMMKSIAATGCNNRCIGVMLTGMGEDGREGVRAIKEAGGYAIAQDPATAAVDSMPESIIGEGLADDVLPPGKISEKLIRLVQ